MKRALSTLAFFLIFTLTLTGCQPGTGAPSALPSQSDESTAPSSTPLTSGASASSLGEGSSEMGSSSDGPLPAPGTPSLQATESPLPTLESLVGVYTPSQDIGFSLSLDLGADSRYQLTVKLLMLSGDVTGSYSLTGQDLTLVAEKVNLPVYTGENVGSLTIAVQEDGSLYYRPDELGKQMGIDLEEVTLIKQ